MTYPLISCTYLQCNDSQLPWAGCSIQPSPRFTFWAHIRKGPFGRTAFKIVWQQWKRKESGASFNWLGWISMTPGCTNLYCGDLRGGQVSFKGGLPMERQHTWYLARVWRMSLIYFLLPAPATFSPFYRGNFWPSKLTWVVSRAHILVCLRCLSQK